MSPILCKAPYNNLILFRLLIKHKTDDHKHNRNRYGKRKDHRRARPKQKVQQDVDDDEDEDEGTVWEIALGLVMIVLLMVGAYLLCVMLPVFLIVTMVLVLKGLIMKLSGKDTADYWKKNFSRMSVLHRLLIPCFR